MAVAGNSTAVGGLTDGGCGKPNGGWGATDGGWGGNRKHSILLMGRRDPFSASSPTALPDSYVGAPSACRCPWPHRRVCVTVARSRAFPPLSVFGAPSYGPRVALALAPAPPPAPSARARGGPRPSQTFCDRRPSQPPNPVHDAAQPLTEGTTVPGMPPPPRQDARHGPAPLSRVCSET